jgi:hypothetical protein
MLTHPPYRPDNQNRGVAGGKILDPKLLARRRVPLAQNHPGRSRAAGNSASKRRVAALRASSPHC